MHQVIAQNSKMKMNEKEKNLKRYNGTYPFK